MIQSLNQKLEDTLAEIEVLANYVDSEDESMKAMLTEYESISERITESNDLREGIQNCTRCHLRKTCKKPVPIIGDSYTNTLVAVGEAPGATEDEEVQAFVGASGELLIKSAAHVGVEISDYFNVVACRPPNNRTPDKHEIEACSANFRAQIEHLQPWMILSFGAVPLEALSDNNSLRVTRDHGNIFYTKFLNFKGRRILGYTFFHPSFILRQMQVRKDNSVPMAAKNAKIYCKKWEEDWYFLNLIIKAYEEFGAEPFMDAIDEIVKEAPYRPGAEELTRSNRETYLQRMDKAEKDIDIPF
jgi:uracil-DNA glycosylase